MKQVSTTEREYDDAGRCTKETVTLTVDEDWSPDQDQEKGDSAG